MSLRLPHSPYYRDRNSEDELCQDYPADKIFIAGLHAMQAHFDHNGVYIDIPILRVMNTAHYIAAYMFVTTCSGDQAEYDVLAYDSLGQDKRMMSVAIIVLAAMLKRTEGFRAQQCRNLLLDNRDLDFEEGVTLYDRFLRSAEERFAEEDFLIDTNTQIQKLQAENQQLISENIQLKYTISTMEKYTQYNIGTQNNNCTINQFFGQTSTMAQTEDAAKPESCSPTSIMPLFKFIHPSVTDENERLKIHLELQNLVQSLPLPDICRYLRKMWKNQRVYLNVKPDIMFSELHRLGMPDETTPGFSKKNFMSYFNIND